MNYIEREVEAQKKFNRWAIPVGIILTVIAILAALSLMAENVSADDGQEAPARYWLITDHVGFQTLVLPNPEARNIALEKAKRKLERQYPKLIMVEETITTRRVDIVYQDGMRRAVITAVKLEVTINE